MTKALVTLINPNKIQPGITPYALDILTTSLEQSDFEVEVVDLTFQRHMWKRVLQEYFAERTPVLVGMTFRNTDTIYPQEQRCFIEDHLEIINEVKKNTDAPIIGGGIGFSSMPYALLEYFNIPFGVKGPGELIICNLADRLYRGESPKGVPGLLIYDGENVELQVMPEGVYTTLQATGPYTGVPTVNQSTPYNRRANTPYRINNLEYYQKGGLGNILTKNGCAFTCTHCVEPDAKGHSFSKRNPSSVVDELQMLAANGVHDVHSTDSEFNLSIAHPKEILREIIARKRNDSVSPLHQLRLWLYCQPMPFDEEFASLLAEAGCKGINFGTDHTVQSLLESWKMNTGHHSFYTYEDIKRSHNLAKQYGMLTMHDILFGMPGETIDTIYQCLDETLALEATTIGYTLGIRIFPYSPLGLQYAEESDGVRTIKGLQSNTAISPIILKPMNKCKSYVEYERQFMFDEFNRLRPVYYFSPELPELPETLESPNGRWIETVRLMREYVALEDHPRVMLPSVPGLTKDDNNYADNPFLMCLVKLGYKGAFWSRWSQRDDIMQEAVDKGLAQLHQYETYAFDEAPLTFR